MQKFSITLSLIAVLGLGAGRLAQAASSVSGKISFQGDAVHLEIEGRNQWIYDVKKIDDKNKAIVQVTLPALDQATVAALQAFSSPIVTKVAVDKNGPDGQYVISLYLVNSEIDSFDYLTEKPSKLIVDFYENQEDSEKAPAKTPAKTVKTKVASKKVAEVSKAPKDKDKDKREPASVDALTINNQGEPMALDLGAKENEVRLNATFDGGDPNFDRFSIKDYEVKEESVIGSQQKVYLEFPMLKNDTPYFGLLQSRPPVYQILAQDTDENKQARLLLTLFEKKRYNVFLKTVEWFYNKYPESAYLEMIQFMQADATFAIWLETKNADDFDTAMLRYRQTLEKYPNSPLMERTMMLMGFATLERGDYLGTLRLFQSHLQKRPQSPNRDIARFAISNAYMKISRYDEALQVLGQIESDSKDEKAKIQAAYYRGDMYYQKKEPTTAIREYQSAQKKYPQAASQFPNAVYNQAAAYFQIKDYRKSLDAYREFLKQFSTNPEAGYAMTRVGEILDILGADHNRVVGTYLETIFRYGDTPTSIVARLRLLSERMQNMKPKESENAVKDIQAIAAKSTLPRVQEFATLMTAEGYNRRKDFERAIDILVKYYQANPTTADTKLLKGRIVKNINENLADLVQAGKFIDALQLHNKYSDNWLKGSDRIDTKFQVGLAYEQSGVYRQAETLYKDSLNKIYALQGTTAGRERNVFEKLPTVDELNLRLASVQMMSSQYSKSFDSIKAIKNPGKMSERDQVERVQLASWLLDKRGETELATRYLTELLKEWSGRPELVAEPYLSLAKLEIKSSRPDDAIKSLKKVSELMDDSQKVSESTHEKSLELLGDLLVKNGKTEDATASYEKLLNLYEKKQPLAPYRYKLGELYFKKGEIQKAADVWNDLQSDKNTFWYQMAQEQLSGSSWKDEYKKYIQRIPAMSEAPTSTERK